MTRTHFASATLLLVTALAMGVRPAVAESPLHQRIDEAVRVSAKGETAPLADDAEFARRLFLDLAGTIPSGKQVRAFLADKDARKREKLIDRLLAGPPFARRMREAFTVMLLERRAGKVVPDEKWNAFLERSFAENKPWDKLVAEILASDGRDEKTAAGIRFFVDGGRGDPDQTTRDIGRLFLGMDLQCAQCHDHPNVKTYEQAHYFGLFAFVNNSKLQGGKFFIATPAAKKIEFESVFVGEKRSTGPRLPGGTEVAIPQFKKGEELAAKAKDGLPAIPKFRPRLLLARQLASAENERFVRNSVNRFWFLMMGRGLVHPLDLMHKDNPASHPKLMELLAQQFAAHKFDVRWLMRELALSETYQRGSRLPRGVAAKDVPPGSYRAALPKPLSAEQMAWSLMQATGVLPRLEKTPRPKDSKFTVKDYINARIDPPDNLPDVLTLFAGVYGNPPGEAEVEFNPSTGHAFFLMNDRLVLDWLERREGNLVDRLTKIKDSGQAAEELYLSVLSRRPTEIERNEAAEHLQRFADRRAAAISDLAWALLASAEFRLNH